MKKILAALVVVWIGSAAGSAAGFATEIPSTSTTQTTTKAKTASSQARSRTRRGSKAQTKAALQPTPTPVTAPATPTATSPTTQDSTPAPPVEATKPENETPTNPPDEEKSAPAKVVAEPSPEEKLREQLKVVEQFVAQGKQQEALAQLHLLAAEDRFDPQGFYNIANAFARLDAADAAVSAYRKALAQRKGNYSRAANNLGVVLLRQGFWEQAYDAFLSALRTENFRYAEASYNLGRLYAARGETDRALREWRRAVKVDPNHHAATSALAGVDSLSRTSPQPPAEAKAVNVVSSSASPRNESAPSAKPFKPSATPFKLDTQSHELLQRARTAHEHGRYEEAVTGFRGVLARNGGYFAPANLELSFSLMELRRTDEAIQSLLLVAEKDGSRFPIAYYHLGRLYELRNDLAQAEVNYLRATQSYQGENAQFLLNLSSVREKRGDFAGALIAMEKYVKRKEQAGQKPDWSETRLKELRAKVESETRKP